MHWIILLKIDYLSEFSDKVHKNENWFRELIIRDILLTKNDRKVYVERLKSNMCRCEENFPLLIWKYILMQ